MDVSKNIFSQLDTLLRERILILDGAMGTMIQGYKLEEADFRSERFANHPMPLKGNNDLLVITQPHIIEEIHTAYIEAGADIIETNSFNANSISQGDYGLEEIVYELNAAAAQVARRAVDKGSTPSRPRFVAGAMGPTTKTLTPIKVDNAVRDELTFDHMIAVFTEQIRGLIDGGCDILLPETSIDTLMMKAQLFAIEKYFDETGKRVPVFASNSIFNKDGRTLSGQTLEAFWLSVSHAPLFAVGLNCGMAPTELRSYVEELSRIAPLYTHAYLNAGLPNPLADSGYDWSPQQSADALGEFAKNGWLNFIGGCCGTTPEHIRAIAEKVKDCPPRAIPTVETFTRFSGLEPMTIRPESNFQMVGERTNVTGSPKFARLIREGNLEEALSIAR